MEAMVPVMQTFCLENPGSITKTTPYTTFCPIAPLDFLLNILVVNCKGFTSQNLKIWWNIRKTKDMQTWKTLQVAQVYLCKNILVCVNFLVEHTLFCHDLSQN